MKKPERRTAARLVNNLSSLSIVSRSREKRTEQSWREILSPVSRRCWLRYWRLLFSVINDIYGSIYLRTKHYLLFVYLQYFSIVVQILRTICERVRLWFVYSRAFEMLKIIYSLTYTLLHSLYVQGTSHVYIYMYDTYKIQVQFMTNHTSHSIQTNKEISIQYLYSSLIDDLEC